MKIVLGTNALVSGIFKVGVLEESDKPIKSREINLKTEPKGYDWNSRKIHIK